jgi:hypothetical protein
LRAELEAAGAGLGADEAVGRGAALEAAGAALGLALG